MWDCHYLLLLPAQGEESPSNTIRRILSRGSLENNVQELLHRGSPGTTKTTTVTSSTPGSKTITKTVITEKEERFEKKEIISLSVPVSSELESRTLTNSATQGFPHSY